MSGEPFPFTAREVARQMGGEASGNTATVPGPGHSRKDRSLSVKIDRSAPDGFLVFSHCGDDPLACRDYVREQMGLAAWRPQNGAEPADDPMARIIARAKEKEREERRAQEEAEEAAKRERFFKSAMRMWSEATSPAGTIVEAYLGSRGLRLPPAIISADRVRFHARCPFKSVIDESLQYAPAMVSLMTDPVTDEPTGIHRTFLRPDGAAKADRPDIGDPKKMLGATKGAVVRLVAAPDGDFDLALAEGIENAIAVHLSGVPTIWAAASALNIGEFPIVPRAARITIYGDVGDAGETAARKCGERWAGEGRPARACFPRAGDWNDAISGAIRV